MKRFATILFSLLFGALVFGSEPIKAGVSVPLVQSAGSFAPQVLLGGANCTSAGVPCTFASGPTGNYIKTGNVVYIQIGFTLSALGNGSGAVTVGNLPFTSQNLSADAFGCVGVYNNLAAAADAFYFQAGVGPNSTVILIRYRVSGVETSLLPASLTASSYIKLTCEYPV